VLDDPVGELFHNVRKWLNVFEYKPNVEIGCSMRHEQVWVGVRMYVPDSTRRHHPRVRTADDYRGVVMWHERASLIETARYRLDADLIPVMGQYSVPHYIRLEHEFFDWLRTVPLTELEYHERDEWFRVGGSLPHNPHQVDVPVL
jgi:hypothetical protein